MAGTDSLDTPRAALRRQINSTFTYIARLQILEMPSFRRFGCYQKTEFDIPVITNWRIVHKKVVVPICCLDSPDDYVVAFNRMTGAIPDDRAGGVPPHPARTVESGSREVSITLPGKEAARNLW